MRGSASRASKRKSSSAQRPDSRPGVRLRERRDGACQYRLSRIRCLVLRYTAISGRLRKLLEGKRKLFWAFAGFTFALDQITKLLLWTHTREGRPPVVLVPHLLRIISHDGNVKGALGLGPEGRLVYILLAVLALGLVAGFFLTTDPRNRLVHLALGLLAGGAVGNLVDRAALGFVRDFVDLHWRDTFHWHTFNVADAAICVGFVLILYDSFFPKHREAAAGGEEGAPPAAA